MMKKIISTSNAPAAIGPYSQAVVAGGVLFISGQIPLSPVNGEIFGSNTKEQTVQVLENLKAVLSEAGYTFDDVVKTTCYLTNMDEFPRMNEVYSLYFKGNCPARATVGVFKLPKGALVEIDAIAVK
jgi:2-iminobutanoate/2-iminopropanoate deaminase